MDTKEEKSNNIVKNQDKMDWRPMIFFYVKTTSWIIFPLLIAVLTGNYVQKSFGSQFLFFVAVMLGFGITCFGIYREIKVYKKSLEKIDELTKLKESDLSNK